MLYTLQHGAVVSKPVAARWAQAALDERWSALIERALVWEVQRDDVNETQDFIRYTLSFSPIGITIGAMTGDEPTTMPAQAVSLPAREHLPTIVERIVRCVDPVRIILFGSQARGQARPDSDLDLLIVLPSVTDKRQVAVQIRRALNGVPVSKDIFVTTPDEIAARGNVIGLVLRPALREGRILYERT